MSTTHTLRINDIEVPCFIIIENRRNARASITKKGVFIRIPKYLSQVEQTKHITHFQQWAMGKLAQKNRFETTALADGQTVYLADIPYILRFFYYEKKVNKIYFAPSNFIHFELNTANKENNVLIEKLFHQLIAQRFQDYLYQIIPVINKNTINKPVQTIKVKNVGSKWGSCSSKGELVFATKLFLKPLWVIHYVIIHELCHRIEMNHSQKFWNLVQKFYPKYKLAKQFLKN